MKKNSFAIFLLLTGIFLASAADCTGQNTKAQKKAEKKQEEQKRNAIKAEEKGRKHHLKLQSRDVQKRMKRNKKRYHHVDSFDRRPGFWQRLFPRKKPSAY
jgi:ribosomal protein L9